MNPYYNFYTPIPGPKTLGEYETLNAILEKGAWAVLICEVVWNIRDLFKAADQVNAMHEVMGGVGK